MRILLCGDTQIKGRNIESDRMSRMSKTIDWIEGLIDEHRPDMFVHMGDLGDINTHIEIPALSLVTRLIDVGSRARQSMWLVGNHDYFTKTEQDI